MSTKVVRTTVQFTEEQKSIISAAAKKLEMPYQTYLKSVTLEHAKKVLKKKNAGVSILVDSPKSPRLEVIE